MESREAGNPGVARELACHATRQLRRAYRPAQKDGALDQQLWTKVNSAVTALGEAAPRWLPLVRSYHGEAT
jgi:hypothetical protein